MERVCVFECLGEGDCRCCVCVCVFILPINKLVGGNVSDVVALSSQSIDHVLFTEIMTCCVYCVCVYVYVTCVCVCVCMGVCHANRHCITHRSHACTHVHIITMWSHVQSQAQLYREMVSISLYNTSAA